MISITAPSRLLRSVSTTYTNKTTCALSQLVRYRRSINNHNNNSIFHGSKYRTCRKRWVSNSSNSTKDTIVSTKQSLSNKNKAILIIPTFFISFGYIANKVDEQEKSSNKQRINFQIRSMPIMSPIPIPTKDKGLIDAIILWLWEPRHWKIEKDFHYSINGTEYMVPKNFEFDGASVPRLLWFFLSPVGILLIRGLVHDYGYMYATLMKKDGSNIGYQNQKFHDDLFRDICIEINGFKLLNYGAYYTLRLVGWYCWNQHKERGTHVASQH